MPRAAAGSGETPAQFCRRVSDGYRRLFDLCGVTPDAFVRTSADERHRETVCELWHRLERGGHLEKAQYGGWYCTPDETFLAESQTEVRDDGGLRVSAESGHPVEWVEEENYVFALGEFKPFIRRWLDDKQEVIRPGLFKGYLSSSLSDDSALDRLSVSRPSSRLHWGIPVPGDPEQVIYVWLDALANYLTACKDTSATWPASAHLIGKDILKFHAVYWPAFLLAAGLPLPREVRVHSHWMVDHEKMSKSRGNVVDPFQLADRFGAEGLRYFLLREGVPHSDGNFSESKMVNYLNSELANTMGNLLSRCTARSFGTSSLLASASGEALRRDCSGQALDLLDKVRELPGTVKGHYLDFEYYKGVDAVMEVLRDANGYVQEEKPWELNKTDRDRLAAVLSVALECLRVSGILLQPIVPQLSEKLLSKLGVRDRSWSASERTKFGEKSLNVSEEKCVLFGRLKVS